MRSRAVDRTNRNKTATAVERFGGNTEKHISIDAKFSRINENEKYISQSTRNWTFGQHKCGLTKLLKATISTEDILKRQFVTKDDY